MMNKSLSLLIILILFMLGGCQLADVSNGTAPGRDMLCGMFITNEPLDFGSSNETIEIPMNGDIDSVLFNNADARIYATQRDIETNGIKNWDFTFDSLEGIRFFEPTVKYDSQDYRPSIFDNEIDGLFTSISDESLDISGTLYLDIHYPFHIYTNPVYQTSDGRVYVVQGESMIIEDFSKGSSANTTLTGTTTETINGVTTQKSIKAELKIEAINTITKIVLKQMDGNDKTVTQTSMTKEHIPESVVVAPNTAYIIMEEYVTDGNGIDTVDRILINTDEYFVTARFTGDNGFAQSHRIPLTHQ